MWPGDAESEFSELSCPLAFPLLQEALSMFKAEWQAFWNFFHCPDMEN